MKHTLFKICFVAFYLSITHSILYGVIKRIPDPDARNEMRKYRDLRKEKAAEYFTIFQDPNSLPWFYFTGKWNISTPSMFVEDLFKIQSADGIQRFKKDLVKRYKIHIMPKAETVTEVAKRIMQHTAENEKFREAIVAFKLQILPYSAAQVSGNQLLPFIVVYINPNKGKSAAQYVLTELATLLHDIPEFDPADLSQEKLDQLKDKVNLCPRFNLPAIPGHHLLCYAQGEGVEKELQGFLFTQKPLSPQNIYKEVSNEKINFSALDMPCKDQFIAHLAGYEFCSEIATNTFDGIKKKLIEINEPIPAIAANPGLLVLFLKTTVEQAQLTNEFIAKNINPEEKNLMTGEQLRDLLQKKSQAITQLSEEEFNNYMSTQNVKTQQALSILRTHPYVHGPISVAQLFFDAADNFALYPKDFTGFAEDYHINI